MYSAHNRLFSSSRSLTPLLFLTVCVLNEQKLSFICYIGLALFCCRESFLLLWVTLEVNEEKFRGNFHLEDTPPPQKKWEFDIKVDLMDVAMTVVYKINTRSCFYHKIAKSWLKLRIYPYFDIYSVLQDFKMMNVYILILKSKYKYSRSEMPIDSPRTQ